MLSPGQYTCPCGLTVLVYQCSSACCAEPRTVHLPLWFQCAGPSSRRVRGNVHYRESAPCVLNMSLWSWTKDWGLCYNQNFRYPQSALRVLNMSLWSWTKDFVIQNVCYPQSALSVLNVTAVMNQRLNALSYSELPLSSISSECAEHVTVVINQDWALCHNQNFRYLQSALSVLNMSLWSWTKDWGLRHSELPLLSINSECTEHVTVVVNQDWVLSHIQNFRQPQSALSVLSMSLWLWTKDWVLCHIQKFRYPLSRLSVLSMSLWLWTKDTFQRRCHIQNFVILNQLWGCWICHCGLEPKTEGFVIQNFRYRELALSVLNMSLCHEPKALSFRTSITVS